MRKSTSAMPSERIQLSNQRAKTERCRAGNGGIDVSMFKPAESGDQKQNWVVNPRGVRAYVRNDTFFKAIPLVLEKRPETRFVCLGMKGSDLAEDWVRKLRIARQVDLLPTLTRAELPDLFRRCQVVVSPTTHDGTPNTLLEAMACGCFPVAGDLESIREWIENGRNGLLVDPGQPLDRVDWRALDSRLRQNGVQEKLTAEWIDHCLTALGEREMQRI